jgi:uncharacterized protein YdiU (UPF0061 family)
MPLTRATSLLSGVGYGAFFAGLAAQVAAQGLPETAEELPPFVAAAADPPRQDWLHWRQVWWTCSRQAARADGAAAVLVRLQRWNLAQTPIRPVIEQLWQAIDQADDWQPLHRWLAGLTN